MKLPAFRRLAFLFAAVVTALSFTSVVRAQVVLASNIGNPVNGGLSLSSISYPATSFSTDATHTAITSVSVAFTTLNSTATLRIFTNATSQPGTDTGLVFTTVTGAGTDTFNFVSGGSLAANTTYWMVLSNSSGTDLSTGTSTLTGTGAGFLGVAGKLSSNLTTWGATMGQVFLYTINATTAVPEPATYAAMAGLAVLGLAVGRRRLQRS